MSDLPINDQWLTTLLTEMGESADQVAETLRQAGIKGVRGAAGHCPVARYVHAKVSAQVREHLPEGTMVSARVGSYVTVYITMPDGTHQDLDVLAPEPVNEFIKVFDAGDGYTDLVDPGDS